jgi:hypothetical protein
MILWFERAKCIHRSLYDMYIGGVGVGVWNGLVRSHHSLESVYYHSVYAGWKNELGAATCLVVNLEYFSLSKGMTIYYRLCAIPTVLLAIS